MTEDADDAPLTADERLVYRLARQTPPTSQTAIAAKLGVTQGTVSRLLASATAKVERLKALLREAGGDDGCVAEYLARGAAAAGPASTTRTAGPADHNDPTTRGRQAGQKATAR